MTAGRLRHQPRWCVALLLLSAVACNGSDLTGPTGGLQVTAATSGAPADLDPDGYTVEVDGGAERALPINGSVTFSQLAAGTHTVRLSGAASNCAVSGQDPASVTVTTGATAHVAFEVACAPTTNTTGTLEVTATTSGAPADLDQDGYTVAVDEGAGQALPVNGSVTFSQLAVGPHSLVLAGTASNCTVSGQNPASVTITGGQTEHAVFQIACGPLPALTGRIAFVSDRDGNAEIYVMNANGTGVTRLTNNGATDGQPAWSPDGKKIAFVSNRAGNDEIYLMNADGSGVSRLTNNPAIDGAPAWSPDGGKIAFHSDRTGSFEIYVMNANGMGVSQLTHIFRVSRSPVWSPDGTEIAFTRTGNFGFDLDLMNADGTAIRRLTGFVNPLKLSWGRTGQIAFACRSRALLWEICVVTVSSAIVTRLSINSTNDEGPTWSPDGTKIAFSSNRNGNFEIYAMNGDGTGVTRLTSNAASDVEPAWGP
jgi:Tol biopolymer transport system component